MKKTFDGSPREEAHSKAREWWNAQKGLRRIPPEQTQVAVGPADSPDLRKADRWAVTIYYEEESA